MSAVKIRESSQNLQNQAVHILLYFNSLDTGMRPVLAKYQFSPTNVYIAKPCIIWR